MDLERVRDGVYINNNGTLVKGNEMKYCFCQVSTNLINKDVPDDSTSEYYRQMWLSKCDDGYIKPDHFWELPLWIAELSHVLEGDKCR